MRELLRYYKEKKKEIRDRLRDFRDNYKKGDEHVFSELCFCLLTPQADALKCDAAIKDLRETGLLVNGSAGDIRPRIKAARFWNNKSRYLVEARRLFKKNGCFRVKPLINEEDISGTRDWLVKNVKGMGYKEASHFLRNIGFGRDLAILDVHILKNLKRCGVIRKLPRSLTKKEYFNIENKLRKFSKKIKIPMDELDLLFWSRETGVVFK
ncbi:MAG: N-glycosylase/DNA lyase [Candidatus Omnitrophota bacterium]